jgi:hypothetical protein
MEGNALNIDQSRGVVYVREVAVADLPDEVRAEAGSLARLYAVHAEDGERLALVKDRQLAYILARQNDLTPVAVH